MADEIEPEVDLERDLDVLQRLDPNFINDPVRLYLREIAETPLLTHDAMARLVSRTTPTRLHDVINRTGTPASVKLAVGVALRGELPPSGSACVLQSG
jgi:hypothetical protein